MPAKRIIENRVIDKRIGRMAQIDREALQQGHLHQHEAEADAGEVESPTRRMLGRHARPAVCDERPDDDQRTPASRVIPKSTTSVVVA